jgi:multidrug efflux pump subunit AcrA (membrane-fusion protein)
MDRITTELLGPMPVADSATRRVQVEAIVPNPDGILPQGLSATAHVQIQESASEEVLLPENCVVIDGLEMIVFRRDPNDPGFVIRTPVELGLRGAGNVEVLAGVLDGDFVVQKGIYQLKQAGLGRAAQGGHFHADGTWHAEHE